MAVGPAAAGRDTIELDELAGVPIATLPADSLGGRLLKEARPTTTLRQVYDSRDAAALVALADRGLCTALLFDEALSGRQGARVLVEGRPIDVPIWLYWRPEETLAPAARVLRDVMRRRAGALRRQA